MPNHSHRNVDPGTINQAVDCFTSTVMPTGSILVKSVINNCDGTVHYNQGKHVECCSYMPGDFGPGGFACATRGCVAMRSWPLFLPSFSPLLSFPFDPLRGNSRGWNFFSPNIEIFIFLRKKTDFHAFFCFLLFGTQRSWDNVPKHRIFFLKASLNKYSFVPL